MLSGFCNSTYPTVGLIFRLSTPPFTTTELGHANGATRFDSIVALVNFRPGGVRQMALGEVLAAPHREVAVVT